MAVVNVGSGSIVNATGSPPKISSAQLAGKNFQKRETVVTTTADDIASHYGFFRIPANAILTSAELTCDALSTSTVADIGLWEVSNPFLPVTQAGSIANAKQYFGASVSLVAAQTKTQILIQSSWTTRAKFTGKRVWEILGLAADPAQGTPIGAVEYDVVMTLVAAVTAGGSVALEISYKMP